MGSNYQTPALHILGRVACLLYGRTPGIRPSASLKQHLLHSCSSEALARRHTAALDGLQRGQGGANLRALSLADGNADPLSWQTVNLTFLQLIY